MKRNTISIIFAVCALLASILLFGSVMSDISNREKEYETEDTELQTAVSEDRFNILMAGTDRTSGLTDVIMLISVDKLNGSVSIMQIPRDTYARYTEKSYKKLNGAYRTLGDGKALSSWLSEALGAPIHRYIVVSPDALCGLVDLVGGVEIELAEPLYYKDPYQNLTISLDKGRHKLDGKTAEQFIRYRSGYENGDIGRIDAQKLFMVSLFKSISEKNSPLMLTKIFSVLAGKTDTNMGLTDIGMLSPVLAGVSTEKIYFATAPGEAVVASKSGASYYSLSASGMSELLKNYFGGNGTAFDPRKVFLNNSYDDFVRVYNGYTAPSVRSAYDIEQSGVKNATIPKDNGA